MTEDQYFQFIVNEQKKTVLAAAKKDGPGNVYHFYGHYGKIVWSQDGQGKWSYEVQSPAPRSK